eukprot:2950624-Rhodomonas_salina.2
MSGTDLAYGAVTGNARRTTLQVSPYDALSGTDLVYAATFLCAARVCYYALYGTDLAYATTHSMVLNERMLLRTLWY